MGAAGWRAVPCGGVRVLWASFSSSSSLGKGAPQGMGRKGQEEGTRGAMGGELEGFVLSVFVQSSDLGAKKELVGAAGAQPLSQISGQGAGRVSGVGGSGVLTHRLSQPAVPARSGGEDTELVAPFPSLVCAIPSLLRKINY